MSTDSSSALAKLKLVLEVASLMGIVAGGAFALVEFRDAQIVKRRDRTMEYIKNYEDGRVGDARYDLNVFLEPLIEAYENGGVSHKVGYTAWSDDLLDQIDNDDGKYRVRTNIDMVVGFYESLAVCVDNELCDGTVADEYFNAYDAPGFWETYWPHIRYRCEFNPHYAQALIRRAVKAGDERLKDTLCTPGTK